MRFRCSRRHKEVLSGVSRKHFRGMNTPLRVREEVSESTADQGAGIGQERGKTSQPRAGTVVHHRRAARARIHGDERPAKTGIGKVKGSWDSFAPPCKTIAVVHYGTNGIELKITAHDRGGGQLRGAPGVAGARSSTVNFRLSGSSGNPSPPSAAGVVAPGAGRAVE